MKNEFDAIKKYLPNDWEESAREYGALCRSREIKTAEELLALNLLYLTDGGSFGATSEVMRLTAGISMNKNAVYKRIKKSWPWLRYLAEQICRMRGCKIDKPSFLGEQDVILIDASDIALRGSKTSDYRLHYLFDLFNFQCRKMELTTISDGESLSRHEFLKKDIVIGDRGYCSKKEIEHVLSHHASFVLRYKVKSFNLYDENGERIDLLPYLKNLNAYESKDINCYYQNKDGQFRPLRIVAMKKDQKAIETCQRKMAHKMLKKQKKAVSANALALNEYIILASNLAYTNEQILELYRARWQIEQVFYRLKSMFGLAEVPSKNPDSVKAWFYGKLFLAALCEAIVRDTTLSPKKKSPSLLLKRSLWNELLLVLKYVTHIVCDKLLLHRLLQKIGKVHNICRNSKRTRSYALQRL